MRKIDLFSSYFFFNVDAQQAKRGSKCGALLTLITVATAVIYLIYLSLGYFNNQIDPKFRTQTFISDDQIDVTLSEDLVGFRFEYLPNQTLDQLQIKLNKTYIVYKPVFFYQNMEYYEYYPLNIINCTNPQLEGYNCLDFSQIQNYTLTINTKKNFLSQIFILVYGCNDIDTVKTSIPDNCALQSDIDSLINNQNSNLRLKLQTTQFNTSTKQIQVAYKNSFIFTSGNQFMQARFKVQQQITTVRQGFLLQYQNIYSYPSNYDTFNQQFDKIYANETSGVSPYVQASLSMDEQVYLTNIQFPIFPEILAVVNSIFTMMMTLGVIGRACAQKLIKQQFFLLFLQNLYLDTYEQILQINNKLKKSENISLYIKPDDQQIGDEHEGHKSSLSITIPSFQTKSKQQTIIQKFKFKDPPNEFQDEQLTEQNELIQAQTLPSEYNFTDCNSNYTKSSYSSSQQQILSKKDKSHYLSHIQIKPKTPRKGSSLQSLFKKQSLEQIQIPGKQQFKFRINKTKLSRTQITSICKTQQLVDQSTQQIKQNLPQNKDSQAIVDYFTSKLKVIQSLDIIKSLKNKIFGKNLWKNKQNIEFPDIAMPVQKIIEQQVNKSLDIFQLYKDIIFLKKAVMILLTKDQLAALQLVGCSPAFLINTSDPNITSNQCRQNQKKKNHFQKQFAISQSEDLQNKYIKKFISRCSNETNINETDYRILTSFIKNESI
ncbi:transmembrane protein, putative (macronuclear) [Tetrahymena thermophila SB210]|uniref:Transmembrane protein, putative n=1 Tax=Tetrahymena thermophila (strain SB210) TaxID=312017 RepID=W7XJQ6_TETTS|nr:transmembrane protein, putative [Tetrahymena thermophila SB210]EWS75811.1 transmembrane protein, putative [Tetrahymena thermophila SB210]|eukprot:XP_012651733.1 transmembrane protein, putative [Tetrahymena thermophila SB210]